MKNKTIKRIISIPTGIGLLMFAMWIGAISIHGLNIFDSSSVRDSFLNLLSFAGIIFGLLIAVMSIAIPRYFFSK